MQWDYLWESGIWKMMFVNEGASLTCVFTFVLTCILPVGNIREMSFTVTCWNRLINTALLPKRVTGLYVLSKVNPCFAFRIKVKMKLSAVLGCRWIVWCEFESTLVKEGHSFDFVLEMNKCKFTSCSCLGYYQQQEAYCTACICKCM